jgi:hypothetical protein
MHDKVRRAALAVVAAGMGAIAAPANAIAPLVASDGTISQITVSPASETEANGNGRYGAKVSDDGRFIAFWSYSPSIAADDDNGLGDVFLYDATTGLTKLISRTDAGEPANGGSSLPQLSANGQFIAFTSSATDLAGGSSEGLGELVYRYNVTTGRIKLVSKSPSGGLPTTFASASGISATGRYVTYSTRAHNIVPGDHNRNVDVFRYDAVLDDTIKVSQTLGGQETNKFSYASAISGNGRFVAYSTQATNMGPADTNNDVDAYVYDVGTNTTTLVSHDRDGMAVGGTPTGISDNGEVVSLTSKSDELAPGDTHGNCDIFLWSRTVA